MPETKCSNKAFQRKKQILWVSGWMQRDFLSLHGIIKPVICEENQTACVSWSITAMCYALTPSPVLTLAHTQETQTHTDRPHSCTVALRERLCETTVTHFVCVTACACSCAPQCASVCRCICICLCMLQRVNLTLQSDDSATVQYDAQMCQVRSYLFGWRFHHSYQ